MLIRQLFTRLPYPRTTETAVVARTTKTFSLEGPISPIQLKHGTEESTVALLFWQRGSNLCLHLSSLLALSVFPHGRETSAAVSPV